MEQGSIKDGEFSRVTVTMNGYYFVFKIVTLYNDRGVLSTVYLCVFGCSLENDKKNFVDVHFGSDIVSMMAVQNAAIEAERQDPGFLERKGTYALDIIAEKVFEEKKRKAKKKVFSIRFDTDLQTKFAEKCKQTGKSQSAVMRKLMEDYISGVEAWI